MIAAVRDGTEQQRDDRLVSAVRDRIVYHLADTVVRSLFDAGLQLSSLHAQVDDQVRPGLDAVVDLLDRTIRDIRTRVFNPPTALPQPRPPSSDPQPA